MKSKLFKAVKSLQEIHQLSRRARERSGKPLAQQLADIAYLKRCNPSCGISDYYFYGLYDPQVSTRENFKNFAGWRIQATMNYALNPRQVVAPAWDKTLFMLLLDAHGLAYPRVQATFKECRMIPTVSGRHLRSIDEVHDFLRDAAVYPLYVKPVDCQLGLLGFYLTGFDREADGVILKNGETLPFDRFIEQSINSSLRKYYRKEAGYLFQDIIPQHSAINEFQGHSVVSGIRIVTLNTPDGPVAHRAVWKLAVGGNSNDNFSLGKYGNLVAQVDVASGRVVAAVNGLWPNAERLDRHPDTGRLFADFSLPFWQELVEQVVKAAEFIPTMPIKHWDIAIGEDGPIFIELNDIGGIEILQLHGLGLLDETLVELIRTKANLNTDKTLQRLVGRYR